MEIKEFKIGVEASKSYQKYNVECTVSGVVEGDLEAVEELLVGTAVRGVNDLCETLGVEDNSKPKTIVSRQPMPRAQQPAMNRPQPPMYATQPRANDLPNNSVNNMSNVSYPVSEKQKGILRKFGYSEDQINAMDFNTAKVTIAACVGGR